jgi:hypothetical protein
MNTYHKYCPNVFIAKCTEPHEKGETIILTTKYGKENESIVFNLIEEKKGFYFYSIVRADGLNAKEYAKNKAEKFENASDRASQKSTQFWEASHEGKDIIPFGQPILVGHHSERAHRALIQRNHNRMNKSVEFSKVSDDYERRAIFWAGKADTINLSMPESLEFYQFQHEKAKEKHEGLKSGRIQRTHSFSLTYAKKELNDLEEKINIAKKLWS